MGFFIVSGLTSKADERIASGILFTESVLHRRKPYSALSQFWPVGLRAGNDLPRRIAFADGRRLWRVGGKVLADSPARTRRYTSTS